MFGGPKFSDLDLEKLYVYFTDKNWNKLSEQKKIELLNCVLEEEKQKIINEGYYNSLTEKLEFNLIGLQNFDIDISFDDEAITHSGRYNYNTQTITICKKKLSKNTNGIDAYCTLMHELQHGIQDHLIKNIENYEQNTKEYNYINKLRIVKNNHRQKIDFCGITGDGILHFNELQRNINPMTNKLAKMFYILSCTERDALSYEKYKKESIGKQLAAKIDREDLIKESIDIFNEMYPEHSNLEIFNLLDECVRYLYERINDIDDLHATIMYDIAYIALILEKEENGEEINEDYAKLIFPENKEANMAKYNYAVYGTDTRYEDYVIIEDLKNVMDLYNFDLEKFNKLTQEQKKNNPKLLLYAATRINDDLTKYIDNLEPLKCYCKKRSESLLKDDSLQKGMEILLGINFVNDLKNNQM